MLEPSKVTKVIQKGQDSRSDTRRGCNEMFCTKFVNVDSVLRGRDPGEDGDQY